MYSTVHLARGSRSERRLTFRNDVAERDSVLSNRDKRRAILRNLLENAVEYTGEGGGITVRGGLPDGLPLAVYDSGPPISETMLPRLFDRFFRADPSRSGVLHCSIGLALPKNLCAILDLSLTATNRADGSVSFRLTALA